MSKRSKSRRLAMRMMYQLDIREAPLSVIFDDLETDQYAEETVSWAYDLAKTTSDQLTDIDTIIATYSINWDTDRLNLVDKALLRIGIAEILYLNTPFQIVINEILELSKEYSTNESTKFINGILDKFVKDRCSPA